MKFTISSSSKDSIYNYFKVVNNVSEFENILKENGKI